MGESMTNNELNTTVRQLLWENYAVSGFEGKVLVAAPTKLKRKYRRDLVGRLQWNIHVHNSERKKTPPSYYLVALKHKPSDETDVKINSIFKLEHDPQRKTVSTYIKADGSLTPPRGSKLVELSRRQTTEG